MTRPLVSVIVPMFNGAATIEETLQSISRQTWRELEIVVVDDGSTDRSGDVARAYAKLDPRVQVVEQANAGVAVARNHGAAVSKADFIAPVDADDLWAPLKIERQMADILASKGAAGLAYTGFARIDAAGRIRSYDRPSEQGHVLRKLCRRNFTGNGSSALFTRRAFEVVGGYDPTLRAQDAQGCEDMMFYLRVAEHFEFRVQPEPLTGYRQTPDNMSSNVLRMYRSADIVLSRFREAYPDYAADIDINLSHLAGGMMIRAMNAGNFRDARTLRDSIESKGWSLPSRRLQARARLLGRTPRALRPVLNNLGMRMAGRGLPTYGEVASPSGYDG